LIVLGETTRPRISLLAKLGAYVELGKLRLSSLAIFAVLAGLYLGSFTSPELDLVVATALGSLLVAVGGNALNQLLEREPDALMERTRDRPLPSGRLTPAEVARFGAGSAGLGLFVLAVGTNWLATALSALILALYVAVYTPLKRVTTLNTLVGAVPGALPPVVGYAAGAGRLDLHAFVLFLILFFWQVPHFLAISWRYREDYARGGYRILAVVDPDGRMTSRQMLVYTVALVLSSWLPYGTRLAEGAYLGAAVCLAILFSVPMVLAAWYRWDSAMRQAFFVSLVYLPLLFAVMVADRA
jgi:protoheme IX farnesyltransferase